VVCDGFLRDPSEEIIVSVGTMAERIYLLDEVPSRVVRVEGVGDFAGRMQRAADCLKLSAAL